MAAVPQHPDLELVGVEKRFGGKTVLQQISLAVRPGEFIAVLGPSGSGKSTLLKIAAGFEHPDSGRVFLRGLDVTAQPPYRRNINTVFQNYALFPHMSVGDNVAYGLQRKKVAAPEMSRRVHDALELVGLGAFGARSPATLSGGEQQRVALARALVNHPAVLLLDEPLSALDLKIRRRMQIELKRIHAETGTTFVFVTHDQEEALVMADRIVVMRDGALEQVGTARVIYDEPATPFVADFVGELNWLRAERRSPVDAVLPDGSPIRLPAGAGTLGAGPAGAGGAAPGPVSLGIRPERVRLAGPEAAVASDENCLAARVSAVTFQGPNTVVEMQMADGTSLRCLCPPATAAVPLAASGQDVRCVWDVAATLVFPQATHLPDATPGDAR